MPTAGETMSLSRSPLLMVSPNKAVKKQVNVKSSMPPPSKLAIVKPLLSKQKILKRKQKRQEKAKKTIAAKQQAAKQQLPKAVPKVSSGAVKKKKVAPVESVKEPLHIVTPAAIVSLRLVCLPLINHHLLLFLF